jgi:hypothetical protein
MRLLWLSVPVVALTYGCGGKPIQEISVVSVALKGCPATATADITAGRGACDEVLPPQVSRKGHEVIVDIEVKRTARVCTDQLITQRETVTLGSFEPGEYIVTARGQLSEKSATFQVPSCQ